MSQGLLLGLGSCARGNADSGLAPEQAMNFGPLQPLQHTCTAKVSKHGKNSESQEETYVVIFSASFIKSHRNVEVTVHSRAARRAASPSIDLDKKLKQTTRNSASPSRPSQVKPHTLAQPSGIQKKSKKGNMTRAQRLRHQKGLERAADVLDKRQVKVVKSLGKEKNIKERSKGWEDVNGEGKKKKKTAGVDGDDDEAEQKADREWVSDEDMDDQEAAEAQGSNQPADAAAAPANIPLPVEEDELL